jgi:hypothetical protein
MNDDFFCLSAIKLKTLNDQSEASAVISGGFLTLIPAFICVR